MVRIYTRAAFIVTAIALFTSSVFAAPQGTFAAAFLGDHIYDFQPNTQFGITYATATQRLFRTGDLPGTCDAPRAAPTETSPTGTFHSRGLQFTSTFTGCITVKFRGTNQGRYSGAAYLNTFNHESVKENLIAYAGDWVDGFGQSKFFSFKVTQGTRYHIVFWSAENNLDTGRIMAQISNSIAAPSDFDGDGQTDSAVFRPSTGAWYILQSSNNTVAVDFFGSNGDVPLDGDFDGDGKTDLGIFRPSNGTWYYKRSSNGTFFGAFFGLGTDKPIPGDYDRDGITDIGAFRDGQWLISPSSSASPPHTTVTGYPFGSPGDIPVGSQRK